MQTNVLNSTREDYLDWVCGLMILRMMALHLLSANGLEKEFPYQDLLRALSCFMAWFFFKSGMFFKPTNHMKQLMKKDFKRLLVPFCVFSAIGYVIFTLYLALNPTVNWRWYVGAVVKVVQYGYIPCNIALWYLLSLFIIRLVCNEAHRRNIPTIVLLIISLAIPTGMFLTGYNDCFLLSHTMMGMFFFKCGYCMKKIQFQKPIVVLSVITIITILCVMPSYVDMCSNALEYGNYFLFYPYVLACVVVINNIAKITSPHLLNTINLYSLGRHSMNYLVTHQILLQFCQIAFVLLNTTDRTFKLLISLTVLLIMLPLFNRLLKRPQLKWMTGA